MEPIQVIHHSVLMFATQLVFIGCRTWNVKAIAQGNMVKTLLSGAVINISWLVSMGLGGVSMFHIINDFHWQYVPIVAACVLGGTAGAYIGMKEKHTPLCKTNTQP